MLRKLIALAILRASRASYVAFVVDGAPDWPSLLALLPEPNATLRVVPYVSTEMPESASAASALATGCTGPLRAVSTYGVPLGLQAQRAGMQIGAVTDACGIDPTVCAFFGAARNRYDTAGVAAAIRGAGLAVLLGGASRPIACPSESVCCPGNTTGLLGLSACPAVAPVVGSFGNLSAASAIECEHMPFVTVPRLPVLSQMVSAAIARFTGEFFLMVGEDRIDHAAHAGDAEGAATLASGVADAVNAALAALTGDYLLVVTGDHGTPMGSSQHSADPVPLLLYGPGATAAALRAGLGEPVVPAVDFPLAFPFFSRGACDPHVFPVPAPPAPAHLTALTWSATLMLFFATIIIALGRRG